MFAAADEFSHLLDDDVTATSSSLADVIGSGAVRRRDNAGASANSHARCSFPVLTFMLMIWLFLYSLSLRPFLTLLVS